MSPVTSRRKIILQWPTLLWLIVVWVLMWGTFTPSNVLMGVVVSVFIMWAFPMPRIRYDGQVRPLAFIYLILRFFWDILVSSFQVAYLTLHPTREVQAGVIRVQLRTRSDLIMTLTAEMTTIIPGSVALEVHRVTGVLYIHVNDFPMAGGVDGMKRTVLNQEARLLRALGSRDELEEFELISTRQKIREKRAQRTGGEQQ